jgi:hypothetical protein
MQLHGLFAVAGAGIVNFEKKIFYCNYVGSSGMALQWVDTTAYSFSYGLTDSGSGSSFAVVLEGVGFVTVQCAVFFVCS